MDIAPMTAKLDLAGGTSHRRAPGRLRIWRGLRTGWGAAVGALTVRILGTGILGTGILGTGILGIGILGIGAVGIGAVAAGLISSGRVAYAATARADGTEPQLSSTARASEPSPTGTFHESASDIVFEHLNAINGLANPVAAAFAEDGDGFLWVASQGGLQRWDGYRFWSYKTAVGRTDSLPDDLVQALYTDWQGRLWLGTSSGGLAMYDRRKDRFVRYHSDPNDLNRVNVSSITGDGGRGLWIGSATGLDHLDTDTGQFTHLELAAIAGRQPHTVSALLRTTDGSLWVGTELGLERSLKPEAGSPGNSSFQPVVLPVANDATSEVSVLFRDRTGRIWVGTPHGAFVVNRTESLVTYSARAGVRGDGTAEVFALPVTAKGDGSDLLATQHYLSIAETSQGEIWLGTQNDGVLAVTTGAVTTGAAANADAGPGAGSGDGAGWQVRHIHHDNGVPTSLSDDTVYALYLGKPGMLWAGTGRGVSYLDTTGKSVFTMLAGNGPSSVIRDTNVYSVLARADGSVWLALSKGGIDILDASGRKTAELKTGTTNPETTLPPGALNGLTEAGDGSLLLTTQKGLYRAIQPNKAQPPLVQHMPIGGEASIGISCVLPVEGKLWIGGAEGLWLLNDVNGKGQASRPELRGQLTDQRVTVLMRGGGPSLWVGTQNGLSRVDLNTHVVESILPNPVDPSALGGGYISSLLIDRKGRLWVGTFSGGIDVLVDRSANGKPNFHRILDGLPNGNIDMLLEAPDGKIWASTDGGLAVIDANNFEMQVLSRADGGVLPAYWNGSGARTAHGELLFGGIGGLTVAKPEMVKPWTYQPPVVVTNGQIGSTDIPLSRFNSGSEEYPIWIAPADNNLTVAFSALDYTAPELNHYEYKLQGFDKNWIPADATRRVARYTNLPPGDYLLLLRGSNREGVWAPERQVRIRVLPAWFQTWWFKIIAVIVVVLLLYLMFLLATAYLRRQQHELERQVALRTAELQQMTVELKESQQKLEHMAYTDALTNLPNRRMFTEHFKRLLALKRRQEGAFAVLLMDFDDFKKINDTCGHDAGDYVLVEMARRMAKLVRESDCLARLGGDEFGLLLGQSEDMEATESVCHKIVASFEEPILFDGAELRTAPSIGIALYPFDGETQDKLYKTADLALYEAKRMGGNRCSWSDAEREPAGIQ